MNSLFTRTAVIVMSLVMTILLAGAALAQSSDSTPIIVGDATLESMQVVLAFIESHDATLYAPDAEVLTTLRTEPIRGRDAIAYYLTSLYGGRSDIRGAFAEPMQVFSVGEDVVISEYIYHGTAFVGNEYLRNNMLNPVVLDVPMISIYEIEDGLIRNELQFVAGTIPTALLENVG